MIRLGVTSQAFTTTVGVMNGKEVYRWPQNVFDDLSKGSTAFIFPAYTPTDVGTIDWTAYIAEDYLDEVVSTATTLVKLTEATGFRRNPSAGTVKMNRRWFATDPINVSQTRRNL